MISNRFLMMTMLAFTGLAAAIPGAQAADEYVSFDLIPNPGFVKCLADPNSTEPPTAHVTVVKGKLNDHLILEARHIKPGLAFDLFTVQNSFFRADGTKDPNFSNFGLAWYQSDLEANNRGRMDVSIRTILLDQIFGFDPNHSLPPTNTFHVGFWFNDPQDAAACGFDLTKPTPFNGEHKAGPMAMMSVPTQSGLGPLCANPVYANNTVTCNP